MLLWCVLCGSISVVRLCRLWRATLRFVLCCINTEWWPRLHGPRPHSSTGANSRYPPKTWMPPHTLRRGGVKHLGPTNKNCMHISSVRLCQLCVTGRCIVLYCSGVCCAALFRCAPLSALACRDALCAMLCAMLHQQTMAAPATRATATLFHGGQVPATSEALRCRHTPVGRAGSKHPGPAAENNAHFSSHLISSHLISSHLISSHVFTSVGSMGLGVALPYAAVMCVALRHAIQGAQPTPSHCPRDAKCQLQWHFVTDGNCPQPLWQPPPTACTTASGAASEGPSLLMHPCPLVPRATGAGGGGQVFSGSGCILKFPISFGAS